MECSGKKSSDDAGKKLNLKQSMQGKCLKIKTYIIVKEKALDAELKNKLQLFYGDVVFE